ncbi:unnamed protein product [Linum tenue]|uniref:Cytochrome P450 n=1 Tax=Linum tenue TaxID=586396 RepID=A0AAV0JKF3_9ROSI|nr:unnamed protein product [Linum tenue]
MKRSANRSPKPLGVRPPGPRKLPVIGNLHQLIMTSSLPHRRLAELARKHGPLMHLDLGQVPCVIVSSPEWAKQVMQTHDLNFANRPTLPAADILLYSGRDIGFSQPGEYWRTMRKLCAAKLLGPKRVKSLQPTMEREMSKMVASITSSCCGHATQKSGKKMLCCLGNAISTSAVFGGSSSTQKQRQEFVPLIKEITKAVGAFSLVDVFPSSKLLRRITRYEPKLKKIHAAADAIMEAVINDHMAKRSTKHDQDDNNDEDLVDVLLDLKEKDDLRFPFSNFEIKAVILDIFIAGTETWTITAAWVMSELMKNPDVMEKAQKEIRQVVFSRNGEKDVNEADIGELNYLELVLKETLRLHTPDALTIPRESQETTVINGYRIPAKTRVIINAWAIGRDPDYWTEPETFNPERFLNSSVSYKGLDFQLIPFGAGRRICPGMHYGVAIVKLVIANLLYHFDWELPNGMMPQELDMSESFGTEVGRKNDLLLIPIPYHP